MVLRILKSNRFSDSQVLNLDITAVWDEYYKSTINDGDDDEDEVEEDDAAAAAAAADDDD